MTTAFIRVRIRFHTAAIAQGMACMWRPGLRGAPIDRDDDPYTLDAIELGPRVALALEGLELPGR